MIKYPKCETCIKEDVCSIRQGVSYAYEQIMNVNTTELKDGILPSKDNKKINITVDCNKYLSCSNGDIYYDNRCANCQGTGEVRYSDAAGSRDYKACSKCKGTGTNNK